MDAALHQSLLSLGLTPKEAQLYLTLLEIGNNPVSSIARKANITRTTAYAALETLKEKGLVSTVEKNGIQQFSPVKPDKLENYAKKLKDDADKTFDHIKSIIPHLKSLTGDLVMAPKVKFFEGLEGIKTVYNDSLDTLAELPEKDRIKYSYSTAPQVSSSLRAFLDNYIKERKGLKIQLRAIMANLPESKKYQKDAKKNKAEVRLMPKDIENPILSEIAIYGTKVAIMSLKMDRLHGVIIDSPEIAAAERSIFELAWRGCK